MKIHKCYFCNYSTKYSTSFKDHVMKKNKCSYLIKSLSINNIEDYYNLVKLHKTDPDAPIWDKPPPDTPPKYYDSDEDAETTKYNQIYIENTIQNYLNKKKEYICQYCNSNFSKKCNLQRHLNGRCKVIKQQEAEKNKYETMNDLQNKELVDQIILLKSLMDKQNKENEEKNRKMEEKIKQLENRPSNSIITTNNNNNNIQNIEKQENIQNKTQITINNFGNENNEIFKDENHMMLWLKKPYDAIPNMIEKLHFTPNKRPENTNIRINNIGNGKIQIYNKQWKTKVKKTIIKDLIDKCGNQLSDTYDLYLEQGKIEIMHEFERFYKEWFNNDPIFIKSQTEKIDCKLIDCVKKHKTLLNSLG